MDKNNLNEGKLQIELSQEVAEGTYANLSIISHSRSEFVADFVRVMPNTPKAVVKSRVILTPENAKRLLFALQDNISKYEEAFGKIKLEQATFVPPFPGVSGEA